MKSQTLYPKVVLLKVLQLTHMPNIKQKQQKKSKRQNDASKPLISAVKKKSVRPKSKHALEKQPPTIAPRNSKKRKSMN